MKILVINAGSSSVKYYLYSMPQADVLARGVIERIGEENSELTHSVADESHTEKAQVRSIEDAMELILETLVREDVGVIESLSELGASAIG